MRETTVDDPAFGKLVWDGFQHEGWAGSFTDDEFFAWGAAITAALPDDDDEEDESPPRSPTDSQDFVEQLLSIGGANRELDEQSSKLIETMRDFARRVDAYDGSLDPEPLRKAGRLKVVVRNPRDNPPTAAQRAAWRAFREDASIAKQIAAAVLEVYREQRPERVRWWKIVYRDSPARTLPDVRTTSAVQAIVRPKEFRVYREHRGGVTGAVVLETLWCHEDVKVSIRDGKVTDVAPVERSEWSTGLEPEELDSPVFGRLRRDSIAGGWYGVYHSDELRGYHDASKDRYRFKANPELYTIPWRPGPRWDVITGNFALHFDTRDGQLPTPEQEDAFRAFNQDPAATGRLVLSAMLEWYQGIRPQWIKHMNGDRERIDATMPDIRSPEGLLEIIQLQSVLVLAAPTPEETAGPRKVKSPFAAKGRKKAKTITIPPKKPGVAIILSFCWEDEHGLGVRWRNGQVEKVGAWEEAINE
jgi:hypothetical protein